MSRSTGALKYELLLFVMAVIWGTAFVAQQIGMSGGLGPMMFNGLRFTLGCLVLLPVIAWRKRRMHVTPAETRVPLKGSVAAGVCLFAAASFQQIGLQYTSSANAGFITGLYILFVPLIGLVLGQRAAKSLWVGVVICMVGFYFLSVTGKFAVSKGDWLILVCSVLWACQILLVNYVASRGDPIKIALIQFAVTAALSTAAALIFESCSMDAVKAGAGAVAYAGIMSVGIAFTLQVVCQKRCPPAPAAIIMSTEAIFAAIAGYVVLKQTMTGRAVFGCLLILFGVLVVQLTPMMRTRKKAAPVL